MNHYRRAAVVQMRRFLRKEGVKKGDILRFRRLKHDGAIILIAVMKDGRQAAIEWKPAPS